MVKLKVPLSDILPIPRSRVYNNPNISIFFADESQLYYRPVKIYR